MALFVSIALGFAGMAAVLVFQGVIWDVVGGVLVMVALVTIIRSVIRLAGEAGTSRGATSRSR